MFWYAGSSELKNIKDEADSMASKQQYTTQKLNFPQVRHLDRVRRLDTRATRPHNVYKQGAAMSPLCSIYAPCLNDASCSV